MTINKLSRLAWKRNGLIGRIIAIRNHLNSILPSTATLSYMEICKLRQAHLLLQSIIRKAPKHYIKNRYNKEK